MSFAKAQELLRFAQMAAARRGGVSLEEICVEFGVSHRTAQRMTEALEATFNNVTFRVDEDRRRYWRLEDPHLGRLQPRQETTIEALEIAARSARQEGRLRHARALEASRDGLIAMLPLREALRTEADAEAILDALGHVARPGPRVLLKPAVTEVLIEGLRGPFRLRVVYGSESAEPRVIEPHGLLLGPRSYLVARQPGRAGLLNFRMDRFVSVACLNESFEFSPDFSLDVYAARAFGAYQDESQYGEVVWRFLPHAAQQAAEFKFHPEQVLKLQPDGSLLVRFHCSGWLEMTWFLYQWGDAVEVLAPEALRRMIEGHRRADFDALP